MGLKLQYCEMGNPQIAPVLKSHDLVQPRVALKTGRVARARIFQSTLAGYAGIDSLDNPPRNPAAHAQNAIKYAAGSLLSNIEVNVATNFMTKLRQYAQRSICKEAIQGIKECGLPRVEIRMRLKRFYRRFKRHFKEV
ncbi:hypothetical protein BDZ88DRAFT_455105 [Geranomyces variabilis]|nr:hypothetical protein BDZ88DRAFT_455105 [Geranomyces variabilis]KAJ3132171.1 hypothetical protein HDU90_007477 [Geranomyces variabilis]